jgi:hypothetical protein
VQEGHVAVLLQDAIASEQLERLTSDLPDLARPSVVTADSITSKGNSMLDESFGFSDFEWLVYCEPQSDPSADPASRILFNAVLSILGLRNNFHCTCFDILTGPSSMLSSLLDLNCANKGPSCKAILDSLHEFELAWGGGPLFSPEKKGKTEDSLAMTFKGLVAESGISRDLVGIVTERLFFTRNADNRDIPGLLEQNKAYSDALVSCLGKEGVRNIRTLLESLNPSVRWPLYVARIGF